MKHLMQRWSQAAPAVHSPSARILSWNRLRIAACPRLSHRWRRRRRAAGSLRTAIIQANSNGQDNTITLQPGVYQLSLANTNGQENGAAQGDLDLTGANHTITIQGAVQASA